MDIDLFSDMVRNLILDNDEVTLPGLGTFVSELMPATFSDKGYTINPPYRRLSFRQRWNEDDTLLADFYSEANGTDREMSSRILADFISGMRETLQTKKVVPMPGLGRLRATKENTFFFIADEDLDIYPYGFGLAPVSLKTHEETPEEVSAAVQELHDIVEAPVEPIVTTVEPVATTVEPVFAPFESEDVPVEPVVTVDIPEETVQAAGKGPLNWALIIPLCIVVLVALFFLVFFLLARFAPDFLDTLLYTKEELRILNYPLK